MRIEGIATLIGIATLLTACWDQGYVNKDVPPDVDALEQAASHLGVAVGGFSSGQDWKDVVPDVQAAASDMIFQVQQVRERQHWYVPYVVIFGIIVLVLRDDLTKKAEKRFQDVESRLVDLREAANRFLEAEAAECPTPEEALADPSKLKRVLSIVQEQTKSRNYLQRAIEELEQSS